MSRKAWLVVILIVLVLVIFVLYVRRFLGPKWKYVPLQEWRTMLKQSPPPSARVCIFSYDDRKNDPNILKLKEINTKYCQKHGYDFRFFDTEEGHPPYWMKVKLAQDLLSTNKYDYIMWLDSDACIHNHEFRVESIFAGYPNHFIAFAGDVNLPGWTAPFNAGIWIFKACPLAAEFLQTWLLQYPMSKWEKQGKKWKCNFVCLWAGLSYEQGSAIFILKEKPFIDGVLKFPWQALQSYEPLPDSFTLHFAGNYKANIEEYYNNRFQ